MHSFYSLVLAFFHLVYSFLSVLSSWPTKFVRRGPLALDAPRKRIPRHLAILFQLDDDLDIDVAAATLIESVEVAVIWCRTVGIKRLTAYDSQGIAIKFSQDILKRVATHEDSISDFSTSDLEYPLTPPLSRPLSPEQGEPRGQPSLISINLSASHQNVLSRRRSQRKETGNGSPMMPITLHLVSRESSKLAIASSATWFAQTLGPTKDNETGSNDVKKFNPSVEVLDSVLQGKHGLSSPDLMVVHPIVPPKHQSHPPLELYGFPPWQIKLTEIYYNRYRHRSQSWLGFLRATHTPAVSPLDELDFRAALDDFAKAEMRLGR